MSTNKLLVLTIAFVSLQPTIQAIPNPNIKAHSKKVDIEQSQEMRHKNLLTQDTVSGDKLGDALQHYSKTGDRAMMQKVLKHKSSKKLQAHDLLRSVENAAYYGYEDIVKSIMAHKSLTEQQHKVLGKALEGAAGDGNKQLVSWIVNHSGAPKIAKKDLNRAKSAAVYHHHEDIADQIQELKKKVDAAAAEMSTDTPSQDESDTKEVAKPAKKNKKRNKRSKQAEEASVKSA